MKPSIGRIVHYITPNGPLAAVITSVSDNEVTLHVWNPRSESFNVEAALEGDRPGCWCWPPKI